METAASLLFILAGVIIAAASFRVSKSSEQDLLRYPVPEVRNRRRWTGALGMIIALAGIAMLLLTKGNLS